MQSSLLCKIFAYSRSKIGALRGKFLVCYEKESKTSPYTPSCRLLKKNIAQGKKNKISVFKHKGKTGGVNNKSKVILLHLQCKTTAFSSFSASSG